MKKFTSLFTILMTAVAHGLFAQAGDLDNTFDTDGKLTTSIGSIGDQAFSVAIQSDGKIVVAGVSTSADGDFTLVRYNTDGSLDSTFGINGIVLTPIGTGTDVAKSVVIQPDGKIIAAGYSSNGTDNDFALVRYSADGSLDGNFGNAGKIITAFGSGDDYGLSVALQPDGKMVVAGYSSNGNDNDFAVARYNADGTLDDAFGTNGKLTTAISAGNDYAYSVAIQPDDKIVVAGASYTGIDIDFALARYSINGQLDNTFGTGGTVTTAIGTHNDFAYSVVIQPDTEIVIGGIAFNGTNNDFALARYHADGSLDNNFGTGGKVTTAIGTDYDYLNAIALQADGKIIAAGDFNNGTDFDFAVARYNADGALDTAFSTDGKVTTAIGTGYDYAYATTIQPDGKIVVVGSSESGAGNDFAVVRYLSDLGTGVIDLSGVANSYFIYPNPIGEHASLHYTLKKEEVISVSLFNLRGQLLATFTSNEKQEAGDHIQPIDLPANLPSGSYSVVITSANGGRVSIKIVK